MPFIYFFILNLWLNRLPYRNVNVTNKCPVACLERAAESGYKGIVYSLNKKR